MAKVNFLGTHNIMTCPLCLHDLRLHHQLKFFFQIKSATISGTCYKKGVVVVCGDEDGELLYRKVLDLIITHHHSNP